MDNLAHSLAGAALAEAGLRKKTGLAMATLLIAANLPDVDVLGLFFDENLAWRRGWTHGPIAMLILPPLLVGLIYLFDRWQMRRGTRPPDRAALHPLWLMALAYIGWLTHPLLDFMNSYGIRLLMPFSEKWFYGDVLFIIDLWLWMILGIGIYYARARRRAHHPHAERPARYALGLACAYMTAMGVSSVAAEHLARDKAEKQNGDMVRQVVANPVPLNPFRREIIIATDSYYRFAYIYFLPHYKLVFAPQPLATQMQHPALDYARRDKSMRDFLYWARLPFARIDILPDGTTRLRLADARYADRTLQGAFVHSLILPRNWRSHTAQRAPESQKP